MTTSARLSWLQRAGVVTMLAGIMSFYFWTACTSEWPVRPTRSYFYSNLLADAFLHGQLHLRVQPNPALLALPNPYDPRQNTGLRLHDASLFNERYYLYYGPVPALLVFLPFRAATGLNFSEPPVVAFFCSVGLLFAFLVVRYLTRTYLPETHGGLLLAAIPVLGFGSTAPFLLRRAVHYEVAVAAAYAFVWASTYYMTVGSLGERVRRGYIVLGSLLLGLAAGARITMLGAGAIALVLCGYVMVGRRDRPLRDHVVTGLAFFGPLAVCVFLLGLYNYQRFGSWTDFGLTYVLQGWQDARAFQFYSLARTPWNLLYYVFVPPRFTAEFPFVWADAGYYLPAPDYVYLEEPVAGILTHVPLIAVLLAPSIGYRAYRRAGVGLHLLGGAFLSIAVVLLAQYCVASALLRYEMDFATFLLVPALLLWYGLVSAFPVGDIRRKLVVATFGIFLAVTVVFNTAFSLVGPYDNLRRGSPETYEAIHNVFRPIERLLGAEPPAPPQAPGPPQATR